MKKLLIAVMLLTPTLAHATCTPIPVSGGGTGSCTPISGATNIMAWPTDDTTMGAGTGVLRDFDPANVPISGYGGATTCIGKWSCQENLGSFDNVAGGGNALRMMRWGQGNIAQGVGTLERGRGDETHDGGMVKNDGYGDNAANYCGCGGAKCSNNSFTGQWTASNGGWRADNDTCYDMTKPGTDMVGNIMNGWQTKFTGGSWNVVQDKLDWTPSGSHQNVSNTMDIGHILWSSGAYQSNPKFGFGYGLYNPDFDLSLDGQADRTIGMEYQATANTAGHVLNIKAGDAAPGSTDKPGGWLFLKAGESYGNGAAGVALQSTDFGGSGTAQRDPITVVYALRRDLVMGRGTTMNTSDTSGFFNVNAMAGAPTANPPYTYTGAVPMVYDTVNNKMCVYNGGWKCGQFN